MTSKQLAAHRRMALYALVFSLLLINACISNYHLMTCGRQETEAPRYPQTVHHEEQISERRKAPAETDKVDFDSTFFLFDALRSITGTLLMYEKDLVVYRTLFAKHSRRLELTSLQEDSVCHWCPGTSNAGGQECIQGRFMVGTSNEVYNLKQTERVLFMDLKEKFLGQQIPRRTRAKAVINEYRTMLIECIFESASFDQLKASSTSNVGFVTGYLKVPWITEGTVTKKAILMSLRLAPAQHLLHPHAQAPVSNSTQKEEQPSPATCLVCGRGLHGEVSGDTIAKQVEFYQFTKVGPLVLYEVGLSFIHNERILTRYVEDGSLLMIDLRKSLLSTHGLLYFYNLLHSAAVGQIWLRYDCILRARFLGYEHVLFVDIDEFVYPGVELQNKPSKSWLQPLLAQHSSRPGRSTWLSIGSLQNPEGDDILCATDRSRFLISKPPATDRLGIDQPYAWDWPFIIKAMNELHVKSEHTRLVQYVAFNATGASKHNELCKDIKTCPGPAGLRKLIVHASVNPLLLRIHDVSSRIHASGTHLSIDKLYVRHHRCLNMISEDLGPS